jgi:hypothetical protein
MGTTYYRRLRWDTRGMYAMVGRLLAKGVGNAGQRLLVSASLRILAVRYGLSV